MIEQIMANKLQEVKNLPTCNITRTKKIIKPNFNNKINIIAEIKAKSPSFGKFQTQDAIINIYSKYAKAISVLTDYKYFGGSFDLLKEISCKTDLPILCKDFIIDKKQIDWAYSAGADIVLLIARILSKTQLKQLYDYAKQLGLECLVEIHKTEELEKVGELNAQIIGVNARDLDTLSIDLGYAHSLLKKFSANIKVAESGIKTKADINRFLDVASVFLIGEAFLVQSHSEQLFLEFLNEN